MLLGKVHVQTLGQMHPLILPQRSMKFMPENNWKMCIRSNEDSDYCVDIYRVMGPIFTGVVPN